MARHLVVEGEPSPSWPIWANPAGETRASASGIGAAISARGPPAIAGRSGLAANSVLDVGQHQLLMLLLVVDAHLHQGGGRFARLPKWALWANMASPRPHRRGAR